MKIWGNFYEQFLQKPSSKFQIFHYMETGIQYMKVKKNFNLLFTKTAPVNSLEFFTVVLTTKLFWFWYKNSWSIYGQTTWLCPLVILNIEIGLQFSISWRDFFIVDRTWRTYFCIVWERFVVNIVVYDITKMRVYKIRGILNSFGGIVSGPVAFFRLTCFY